MAGRKSPIDKRLRSQFKNLSSLRKVGDAARKARWAEFRAELLGRLRVLEKRLAELQEAKTLKRKQARNKTNLLKMAKSAGQSYEPREFSFTSKELTKILKLRVKVTELKIMEAVSSGLPESNMIVLELRENLARDEETLKDIPIVRKQAQQWRDGNRQKRKQ
jgi:hypothetical protein